MIHLMYVDVIIAMQKKLAFLHYLELL